MVTFQARSYNRQMRPAILDHSSGAKWTNTSNNPEFLVGEEVRLIFLLDEALCVLMQPFSVAVCYNLVCTEKCIKLTKQN